MSTRMKKLLKHDSEYKKFKLVVSKVQLLADFDNLSKEMELMHQSRLSRELHLKTPSVDRIIKASAQATAYRSRTVEIMVNVQKAQRTLNAAIERMEAYIATKYKIHLVSKTVRDKELEIQTLLKTAITKLKDFDRIVDMCQEFVKDIESFIWVAKLHMQGLELIYTRENIVKSKLTKV